MRTLILAAFAALTLWAADGPPKPPAIPAPKPLPIDEQEKLSRLMIRVQGAEIDVYRIRSQPTIDGLQLHAAEVKAQQTGDEYRQAVAALSVKYGCPGCAIDVEKNWVQPEAKR